MKKYIFIIIFTSFLFFLFPQQNKNFLILEKKNLATFNDGITLLRLLYNETDDNANFVDNILWAVDKKLFQVTIPIKPDTINPELTRGEFSILDMQNIQCQRRNSEHFLFDQILCF